MGSIVKLDCIRGLAFDLAQCPSLSSLVRFDDFFRVLVWIDLQLIASARIDGRDCWLIERYPKVF
ncbi:MAG: hypothetical protein CL538_05350 [Alcanivorax sp.]|nr:hypothetical protein [Alcanivorax sp.]